MPETPEMFAAKGEEIYARVRAEYEHTHAGQYVAVDVTTEELYPAATPEAALEAAQAANPQGAFHLIRVGAKSAFKVSSMLGTATNGGWTIRF